MIKAFGCGLLVLGLICNSALAGDKLATLAPKDLQSLVSDLNSFYKQSLDSLFTVNGDDQERQLGLRALTQALSNYDARVAGRCTNIATSEVLNKYISVAYARMTKSADAQSKLFTDYAALLKKYELTPADMRVSSDCPVFEYDLEPFYEAQITVYEPGFWWWQKDNQVRTFIRLTPKAQKSDGTVELEGYVGAGAAKGFYHGVAKRDLHSTSIEVSLMRDGSALLIDGELSMSGQAFKDPLTDEVAPKMPARVLSGFLTVHDPGSDGKHTLNNAVMFLARESDQAIGAALEGFKVPANASYGSYLNVVVVSYKGPGVGANAAKFAALIDDAYKGAQQDNPVQSFHPTRKPLFLLDNEVAFLITDIASDVNAEAAHALKSAEKQQAARALGAQSASIIPFYKVKAGKLRIQFPGRPAGEMKFDGFEQLAKSIFTMYAALSQEQQQLFEKFGIKALSDQVKALQNQIVGDYKAMGPMLDAVLDGQAQNADLDKTLSADMDQLLKDGQKMVEKLASILDSRDGQAFANQYADYLELQKKILEAAAAGAPADKAEAVHGMLKKFGESSEDELAKAQAFAGAIKDNATAIERTLNYMNTFTVHVEFEGSYVGAGGKLNSFTWKWDRTLSPELEAYFKGEKYDPKKTAQAGRRGD